jgi:hypothetical protein
MFVALVIQHAMACAILSSVVCPTLIIFSRYLIKAPFQEKKLLNMKGVFSVPLQLLSKALLVLRTVERDMIKKYTIVVM